MAAVPSHQGTKQKASRKRRKVSVESDIEDQPRLKFEEAAVEQVNPFKELGSPQHQSCMRSALATKIQAANLAVHSNPSSFCMHIAANSQARANNQRNHLQPTEIAQEP